MSELNCIIADDEPLALELLGSLLEKHIDIRVVAACRDGQEALTAIQSHRPDLAFLDIEMPGLNGFEVVERVQVEMMPAVVFTTAFNHYAIEAFDIHAVDYVLKPINKSRLELAVERSRQRIAGEKPGRVGGKADMLGAIGRISRDSPLSVPPEQKSSTANPHETGARNLVVRDSGKTHVVNQASIDWIDAAGDYMCIHLGSDTLVARMTMKNLEELLNPEEFVRIHRSTMVNVNRVERLESLAKGDCILYLEGGGQLKASRRYRDRLMGLLSLI